MANLQFTLRNDVAEVNGKQIGRFDAFFPEVDKNGDSVDNKCVPKYIKIDNDVFKSQFNGGNNSIFISPSVREHIPKDTPPDITYKKASKRDYFWYKIKKDKNQLATFWALIAAILGVLIDVSFAIGKIHVFVPLSQNCIIIILLIGMILKIFGLLLAFKKGFWEAK